MASITFASLPTEIHLGIAEYCQNNDLINLCLTSKRVNEICLQVLYRHVDLRRFDRRDKGIDDKKECYRMLYASERQQRFILTLLSHPEYGKHVRYLKGMLWLPGGDEDFMTSRIGFGVVSEEELWQAMQSLTNVQTVDVGSRNGFAYRFQEPTMQFPVELFRSATSVRLAGHIRYGLAKAILNSINPATLKHLCIDMAQDRQIEMHETVHMPSAMSGLLTTFSGHCTALRTLILRRAGLHQDEAMNEELAPIETASYVEWASFVSSVQGTLETFVFEYSGESVDDVDVMNNGGFSSGPYRNMGENFRRLILPAIVSGTWPCLTFIKLRGIRSSHPNFNLGGELQTALGGNVKIVVRKEIRFL